jgi:ribose-phosphate pyrophosphokinase
MDKLTIFTGNANPKLGKDICESLGKPLGDCKVSRFSDGEIQVKINQNIRGTDVFIIQPTCYPAEANLMELLIMIDAAARTEKTSPAFR